MADDVSASIGDRLNQHLDGKIMPATNIPFSAYHVSLEQNLRTGYATEHTHRPALKALVEALRPNTIATNEPRRVACGAPDYVVAHASGVGPLTIGYIEAKDIGISLNDAERSEQLKRYLAALPNLILTDYVEFRWYVDGLHRSTASIGHADRSGRIIVSKDGVAATEQLLAGFLDHELQAITKPYDLAVRMAHITHMIRDIIVASYEQHQPSRLLDDWREAFAKVLIADLATPERTADFADMFAQTLAYGLFSARVTDITSTFTRETARRHIPRTNPFLRDFFSEISGIKLDDEPYAVFVDDLVALLAHTDMDTVLADFGKRTKQQDPVVHFYETFLAAYDPRLREARGVYYTPEPVVSYIVRSVDALLKSRFGARDGLADSSTTMVDNYDPSLTVKGRREVRKKVESHKVLVLDPACGTATFLYAVIDHIRAWHMETGNAGMWPGYIRAHVLPRLFGFELLMAPYAVAHFKLGLQLAGRDLPEAQRDTWSYDFASDERLGVYLTNTLEGPHEMTGLPLFTQWVADETNAANRVKRDLPVLVIMGNPPYSGQSANNGQWIRQLLRGHLPDGSRTDNYYEVDGAPLGERNPKWLQDDYVKFLRFGQWRLQRTGNGIMALITNHGYLDNPTFRGMRQSLLNSFSTIYILNLHGNTKKKEVSPDGSVDQNVFDIQQGVCIGIFVMEPNKRGPATVYYADLWGKRESKYAILSATDVTTTAWTQLRPAGPFYLFVPQDVTYQEEYDRGWKITTIMPVNSVGIATARDHLTIHWTEEELVETIERFVSMPAEQAREAFRLGKDAEDWKVSLAQADISQHGLGFEHVVPVLYRPFDVRYTYYTGQSRGFLCRPRPNVMRNMLVGANLGLLTSRLTKGETFAHVQVTRNVAEVICMSSKTSNNGFLFPLYIYANTTAAPLLGQGGSFAQANRRANFSPAFIVFIKERTGLEYVEDGHGDLQQSIGPDDIFEYMYGVLHAPSYRTRYAEFLRGDYPRIPFTADLAVFRTIAAAGSELVALQLMEADATTATRFPIAGDNIVRAVRYTADDDESGKVWINERQFFDGVPEKVWLFLVGGYRPCEKWLTSRKGRELTYDELTHYQRVVAVLTRTLEIMDQLEEDISAWPLA